ncbi:MAG: DUF4003 domain-containing protein [Chromatiaceae bacterium]|jgi:hypothetical protein|nr:DUF4003 domain-containing protein [Chromatiaceae bacterium]
MLEFVFFDPDPRRRFVDFVRTLAVAAETRDEDETFVVAIREDTDDELMERIEACYEEMMALDQVLFESRSGDDGHQAAGVVLNLASGDTVYARVDPALLGRIMAVLTPQEFGDVVNAIVDAVENPDARPLCHAPGSAD